MTTRQPGDPASEMAARIIEIERRCWPEIMVWNPTESVTGKWEAVDASGWELIEEDPAIFCEKLEKRLES